MLPAPASIAAAPRPKSRASWNPAVPPPPVAVAAVGNGLADRLGDADRPGDAEGRGEADRLGEAAGREDVEGLVLGFGVVALAVPLAEAVGVADALVEGEDGGSAAEDGDVVQAETAAEASMAAMPQPTAVNLALRPVPAMAVRTFMKPPHASGRRRPRFPVPVRKRHRKGKRVADPVAARAG